MARTGMQSWTERGRRKGVFVHGNFLAVGMVISVGVETRVASRLCERRIGTIPVAVLGEIPIADVVIDPPSVIGECPCRIVARRKPAVAILERRLAVVPAGAVQGDSAVVALALHCKGKCKAAGAIRVQVAAGLAGKEMTGNDVCQWIIGSRATHSPDNDTLHIVVVIRTAGVAGLQRGVESGALSGESAQPLKETIVGKLRSPR